MEQNPWPVRTLHCIDAASAQQLAAFMHNANYPEAAADGDVVTFQAHPADTMRVADFAFSKGWAHDGDAAALMASL